MLGDGDGPFLAVRAAIAHERRRLGDASGADTVTTSEWIQWLEDLPWTRRAEAAIGLARVCTALDAGHAGLDHAKARIVGHLAVRRRNPRSVGNKTLAALVADALGRARLRRQAAVEAHHRPSTRTPHPHIDGSVHARSAPKPFRRHADLFFRSSKTPTARGSPRG